MGGGVASKAMGPEDMTKLNPESQVCSQERERG